MRRIVKRVIKFCWNCQRVDARACSERVVPLPKFRVTEAPPFAVTGVDHAGPLFVIDQSGHKLYICLFTCAVTRALHLELTDSLSLSDFLLAFRRFCARRGVPSVMYSDNARTFGGAASVLSHFAACNLKWKFIVPGAPWWGGWWERLVRSVKSALRKTVSNSCLTRVELETILMEIEAAINSRPLTVVRDDENEVECLTPNHFLIGRRSGMSVEVFEDVDNITQTTLKERRESYLKYLDTLWFRWRSEYITSLPYFSSKSGRSNSVDIDSVVLIRDDMRPRMQWPLGVVVCVYPGRDGLIRAADVKTDRGIFKRPIQKLHRIAFPDESCVEEIVSADELPSANDLCSKSRFGRSLRPPERFVELNQ